MPYLVSINLPHSSSLDSNDFESQERNKNFLANIPKKFFSITTCQRTFLLGPVVNLSPIFSLRKYYSVQEILVDQCAYTKSLSLLCGLSSKLQGETEIVKQFKIAVDTYLQQEECFRDKFLTKVLHHLQADSKKIRTEHLNNIGQHSYAGLTKKLLQEKKFDETTTLVILGTGKLCEDLLLLLAKRFNIIVLGRNKERFESLRSKYTNFHINFHSLNQKLETKAPIVILNTVPEDLTRTHSNIAKLVQNSKFLVDLSGENSLKASSSSFLVPYANLEILFKLGATFQGQKQQKLDQAKQAICTLAAEKLLLKRFKESLTIPAAPSIISYNSSSSFTLYS